MASDHMTIAALGRPFTLGMLYDARKDKLVLGPRFWNDKTLKEKTTETPQQSCIFEIFAFDSIKSKSKMLEIEASLKKELIENGSATHVVTGIVYGANAFFVFDSERLENSEVQKIEDSMQAVIKKIPSLNIDGKVGIKLTDEEKALTNTFSSKFYGDFILESNPATFQDAVQTYTQLPKLLGTNGENSVPVKVWLMPLKSFDPKAAELMRGISVGLVIKAQEALEHLKETQMRCNDSLEDKVIKSFPVLQKS
ncbi:Verrucotoxin subunit beta [Dissostichus eleginoides]|uniref:Verrucotoxin subunit beta n=1 Tax=Dissostichus eleginoides TaxID=100907 RepID=A0AAD9BEC0_DISEL|nr:Verrucotoxin subunit beta [Dissostichus eleginoides]